MSALYLLPHSLLAVLIMAQSAILGLQVLCIGCGFFGFRYDRKTVWRSLLEASIFFCQLLLLLCSAETINHMNDGFMVVQPHGLGRYGLFALLLVLSIVVSCLERRPAPLGSAAIAGLTLPVWEQLPGPGFCILVIAAVLLWLLRERQQLQLCRRRLKTRLSVLSVNEAIDTMDFGILLCRAEDNANGQILLLNTKMQTLMASLTGTIVYDGAAFYEALRAGQVLPACRRDPLASQPVYALPDGSVWRFDRQLLSIRRRTCSLLLAFNMTEQEQMTDRLYRKNRELEQRNQELKAMLSSLNELCRTEETLRAKSQVHNVLGQQISLLLRSVREDREPDEALLQAFARGLPELLKQTAAGTSYSLQSLVQNFASIGIRVLIDGTLPPGQELQKAFYSIITEGVTNAVHHGYATEISVSIRSDPAAWQLSVTDNGASKAAPIQEGGGLTAMRRKAEALGGSFTYETSPHFSITVTIPRGNQG